MDAVTKFSEKKQAQEGLPALLRRLERAEKLVSALISDVEFIKQRLDKVEVVKAGPQEPDIADEQRPETE